jgi:hypothetical protein
MSPPVGGDGGNKREEVSKRTKFRIRPARATQHSPHSILRLKNGRPCGSRDESVLTGTVATASGLLSAIDYQVLSSSFSPPLCCDLANPPPPPTHHFSYFFGFVVVMGIGFP